VKTPVLEGFWPIGEHHSQRRFVVGANDPLFQPLRSELHQRGGFPLLVEPTAKCVHRAEPCVARDGLYAAFTKTNHECRKVGLVDLRGRLRLRLLEGVPRRLIPIPSFWRDVVNVSAFPQELIEELIEGHGDSGSLPTSLPSPFRANP